MNQDPARPLTCFLNMGESSSLLKNMAASASPAAAAATYSLHTATLPPRRPPRHLKDSLPGDRAPQPPGPQHNHHHLHLLSAEPPLHLRPPRATLGTRPTNAALRLRWHRNPRQRPESVKWRRFAWGERRGEESNGSAKGEGTRRGEETGRGKEKSVRWKITVRFISD